MLTKTRTIIITLVASASFAIATVAPAVSQAETKSGSSPVTCSGGSSPGDIKTTSTTTVIKGTNGTKVKVEETKEICGSDGQWHKVESLATSKTGPVSLVGTVGTLQTEATKTTVVSQVQTVGTIH